MLSAVVKHFLHTTIVIQYVNAIMKQQFAIINFLWAWYSDMS